MSDNPITITMTDSEAQTLLESIGFLRRLHDNDLTLWQREELEQVSNLVRVALSHNPAGPSGR